MIEVTNNIKHKLVLVFLYYAGLRLNEVRNLQWQGLDFDRKALKRTAVKFHITQIHLFLSLSKYYSLNLACFFT
ncbi:MAG: tyrosine-type recombinase/integrase [Euryarchaeota archaeon]|nr:tyrosine-type recombinase/integrase [Euryarchaeota archaeon]